MGIQIKKVAVSDTQINTIVFMPHDRRCAVAGKFFHQSPAVGNASAVLVH